MTVDFEKVARDVQKMLDGRRDGHAFDHIERVVRNAEEILKTEPEANRELVILAAYLHDLYDAKIINNKEVAKVKHAVELYLRLELKYEMPERVLNIIDKMSFSANLDEQLTLTLEGQIVQDADRLDAMGSWGIVRTLYYGWKHHRTLYDPDILPRQYSSAEEYHHDSADSTTLNHFYEKLFKLRDLMNTEKARELAAKRHQLMVEFVKGIENEYFDFD